MKSTYIIQICNARYEAKVENGTRLIKAQDKWLDPDQFIDYLAKNDCWDQICQLAIYGKSLLESKP